MTYTYKSALSSAPKLLTTAMLSIILVACGGGTSGDGDGTLDSGSLDSVGTTDVDGGFDELGLDESGSVDAGGFTDEDDGFMSSGSGSIDESLICSGQDGSDEDSSNFEWGDNCEMRYRLSDNIDSPFRQSTYTRGIQRIVFCSGAAHAALVVSAGTTIEQFVDSDFGPDTEEAVMAFQTAEGLVSDGVVGPLTWERLQSKVLDLDGGDAFITQEIIDGVDVEVYGILTSPASIDAGVDCSFQRNFLGVISSETLEIEGWRLTDVSDGFGLTPFSTGF